MGQCHCIPLACLTASACSAAASTDKPVQTGMTITKAHKSVTGLVVQQTSTTTTKSAQKGVGNKTISSPGSESQQPRPHIRSQPDMDDELATVSSVSLDAIPGLRKQASVVDPEQKKQLEKGWGLSYKDPNAPVLVRKEVFRQCLWCCVLVIKASRNGCYCHKL